MVWKPLCSIYSKSVLRSSVVAAVLIVSLLQWPPLLLLRATVVSSRSRCDGHCVPVVATDAVVTDVADVTVQSCDIM